jgi:hypothetical protein
MLPPYKRQKSTLEATDTFACKKSYLVQGIWHVESAHNIHAQRAPVWVNTISALVRRRHYVGARSGLD